MCRSTQLEMLSTLYLTKLLLNHSLALAGVPVDRSANSPSRMWRTGRRSSSSTMRRIDNRSCRGKIFISYVR